MQFLQTGMSAETDARRTPRPQKTCLTAEHFCRRTRLKGRKVPGQFGIFTERVRSKLSNKFGSAADSLPVFTPGIRITDKSVGGGGGFC